MSNFRHARFYRRVKMSVTNYFVKKFVKYKKQSEICFWTIDCWKHNMFIIKDVWSKHETPRDTRGNNPKTHAIPEQKKYPNKTCWVVPHKTATLPVKEVSYLDARLNVKLMYELFKKKHPNSTIKYDYYLKYFQEHFNYRFDRSQVDTYCNKNKKSIAWWCSKTDRMCWINGTY